MAAPASGPAEEAAASMEGAAGEKDAVAGAQAAVSGAPEGVVVSDEAAAAGADAQAAADDAAAAGLEAAQAAADGSSTASLPSVAQAANALPGFTVQSLAALQSAAAAVPKPATAEVAALGQSFADKVTGAFNTFNYSSVPWNSIAHKVNTQADKAAKQVYAKIENKLPAVNETALEAKLHAPVEKLNATVSKVKAKVAGAIEWEAPTKLNATINNPKFKDAVNKTVRDEGGGREREREGGESERGREGERERGEWCGWQAERGGAVGGGCGCVLWVRLPLTPSPPILSPPCRKTTTTVLPPLLVQAGVQGPGPGLARQGDVGHARRDRGQGGRGQGRGHGRGRDQHVQPGLLAGERRGGPAVGRGGGQGGRVHAPDHRPVQDAGRCAGPGRPHLRGPGPHPGRGDQGGRGGHARRV